VVDLFFISHACWVLIYYLGCAYSGGVILLPIHMFCDIAVKLCQKR
jgi:hypothetical protein